MKTNLHLGFSGKNCDAAFAFYETVFDTKRLMTVRWGDAPPEVPYAQEDRNLVLHTAIKIGSMTLMGADAHP